MNKILVLLFFTFITFSSAKMVDGISLIVEGEAVTTAEIRAVRSQMGVSKSKAIDLLIQDRLQKVAMKDITVPEDEVDAKIAEIAKQNNITIPKMQKILKQQGTSWVQYRAGARESLKKARFYQEIVIPSIPEPSEDELKLFYNEHRKQFNIPKIIYLTEYSAKSEKALQNFIRLGKHKNKTIRTKKITKQTKSLGEELLFIFLQTPKNSYTKILNAGDQYIAYKVRATSGKRTMPFDIAHNAVMMAWKQKQQGKAVEDYFKKLRTRADIQILR